jgi:hypothetical protein
MVMQFLMENFLSFQIAAISSSDNYYIACVNSSLNNVSFAGHSHLKG